MLPRVHRRTVIDIASGRVESDEVELYGGPWARAVTMAAFDQDSYAFYDDDGSESASTQTGSTNTQTTLSVDTIYHARILVQETAGASGNYNPSWEYNHNGGGWTAITTTSSVVKAVDSSNLTDGNDTTQRIGGGTFDTSNGWVSEDGTAGNNSFAANAECEALLAFQIVGADVSGGDEILLRLSGANSYTREADIDVDAGSLSLTVPLLASGSSLFEPAALELNLVAPFLGSGSALFVPELDQNVELPIIVSTVALFEPGVELNIEMPLLASASVLFVPELDQNVELPIIASTVSLFDPAVELNIVAPLLASGSVLHAPTDLILQLKILTTPLLASTSTLFAPQLDQNLTAPLLASTVALLTPELIYNVEPPLLASTTVMFAPTEVRLQSQTVAVPFIVSGSTLFAPGLDQSVEAPLLGSTAVLFVPGLGLNIAAPFLSSTASLFAPELDQNLNVPLIGSAVALFSPTVSFSGPVNSQTLTALSVNVTVTGPYATREISTVIDFTANGDKWSINIPNVPAEKLHELRRQIDIVLGGDEVTMDLTGSDEFTEDLLP